MEPGHPICQPLFSPACSGVSCSVKCSTSPPLPFSVNLDAWRSLLPLLGVASCPPPPPYPCATSPSNGLPLRRTPGTSCHVTGLGHRWQQQGCLYSEHRRGAFRASLGGKKHVEDVGICSAVDVSGNCISFFSDEPFFFRFPPTGHQPERHHPTGYKPLILIPVCNSLRTPHEGGVDVLSVKRLAQEETRRRFRQLTAKKRRRFRMFVVVSTLSGCPNFLILEDFDVRGGSVYCQRSGRWRFFRRGWWCAVPFGAEGRAKCFCTRVHVTHRCSPGMHATIS